MAVERHLFRALVGEDVDQQAVVRDTKDSLEHKIGLVGRRVETEYDSADNPTLLRYPSGLEVGQLFDALDRPSTIGEFLAPPVHVEEMYDPDVFGEGLAGRLEVSE